MAPGFMASKQFVFTAHLQAVHGGTRKQVKRIDLVRGIASTFGFEEIDEIDGVVNRLLSFTGVTQNIRHEQLDSRRCCQVDPSSHLLLSATFSHPLQLIVIRTLNPAHAIPTPRLIERLYILVVNRSEEHTSEL